MKYLIWRLEYNENTVQMIEVLNEKDILEVQREFVNKGFIIDETFKGKTTSYIRVLKANNEVEE